MFLNHVIALATGCVVHQIQKMVKCNECPQRVLAETPTSVTSITFSGWVKTSISRWLIFGGNGFALLDHSSRINTSKFSNNLICRTFALEVLNTYNNKCNFSCQTHEKPVKKCVNDYDKHFFQLSTKHFSRRQSTTKITKQNVESSKQRL